MQVERISLEGYAIGKRNDLLEIIDLLYSWVEMVPPVHDSPLLEKADNLGINIIRSWKMAEV